MDWTNGNPGPTINLTRAKMISWQKMYLYLPIYCILIKNDKFNLLEHLKCDFFSDIFSDKNLLGLGVLVRQNKQFEHANLVRHWDAAF